MDAFPDRVQIGSHVFGMRDLTLRGPSGEHVPLRAQSAEVLKVLAGARGQLVKKDRLMSEVWPDRFVTDDSLVKCISDIRKALAEDAALLITAPKKGYRLEGVMTAGANDPESKPRPARSAILRPAVVFLALGLSVVVLAYVSRSPPVRQEEATIAVLPFRNSDGDPEQRYLSDGVAEDLITALSQLSDLRVISQGASFAYAPDTADIRTIAAELDADVVLEGSIRSRGTDLRVTTALVDGTTGENLWAKHYDGDRDDLLAFQTDLLDALVRTLSVRLSRSERARLGVRGTEDVEAHDAYLRGRELENLYTRETNLQAEAALRRAIARDPDYALAHAHLALTLSFRAENRWSEDREATAEDAFAAARTALRLDPDLPFAHFVLGRLYSRSFSHHLPDAMRHAFAAFDRAIELDPNYLDAYVFMANLHIFNGEAGKALPLVDAALARHPAPPYWYIFAAGMARYYTRDFEGAEPFLVRARDQNPTAPFPYRYLIATYGMMGRVDDAEWAALEYEALGRTATVEAMVTEGSVSDEAYRKHFAKGLRAAGLPEI